MASSRLHETTLRKLQNKKNILLKEKDALVTKLQDIDRKLSEFEKAELTLNTKYNKAKKKEEEANKEWEAYEKMADELGFGKAKPRVTTETERNEELQHEEN